MSKTVVFALPLVLLLSTAPPAQARQGDPADDGPRTAPDFRVELPRWRQQHGAGWRALADPATGYLELLHGGNAAPGFVPDTSRDDHWVLLARQHVRATEPMHGIRDADLGAPRVVYLPLGMAHGTDKITVRLHQAIGGVPVENGAINALFDTSGRLLSLHSSAAPAISGLDTRPTIGAGDAAARAARAFSADTGLVPTSRGTAELVVAQVQGTRWRTAHLAWQVDVQRRQPGEDPVGWLYSIDARSGQVLEREASVHFLARPDVTGQVKTLASPGVLPDMASNPPAELEAGHIRVQSSAGAVFTDRDGNFSYPGVTTPLDITVTYSGRWNNVNNVAGGDYTVTFPSVQPGQSNTLVMNPAPAEFVTSQANVYRHVGIVRDYIRDTVPSDPTADFLAISNVNINNDCNAFYDGSSINFYRRLGACYNTGYSSVVTHEYGHWLNQRYGTGNGNDGMGEGNADVFSMYVYDDPVVGRFFLTSGGFVRTGTNNRQFCGDSNPGCYGGVHADGEVWMGAAWKVRANLNTSLGGALGDATSDGLFMGWMNAYNQSQIRSIIEIQWLTLDDDDGDITNGTPNYFDIDAGFRQQGFPGYELTFVSFANVTELAHTTNEVGPYVVEADVVAQLNPPLASLELRYRVDGGNFISVPMLNVGGDTFQASIPGVASPTRIDYYLEGSVASGGSNAFPAQAPEDLLTFYVGTVTSFLVSDFEGVSNEGWTVGDVGNNATTGIWTRVDPVGTAAQPEDDHTPDPGVNAWITGQQPAGGTLGTNDVDDGTTTLKSPVFDASGLEDPTISYSRWYSNNTGNSPNADVFVVDISGDGGATWVNVETVGPAGTQSNGGWFQHTFRIRDFISPPTAQVRLRFVASDLGAGSIVEAALDDIEGLDIGPSCPAPTSYCPTSPNSIGAGAQISVFGSQSVASNSFFLYATDAPPGEFGLFLYGQGRSSLPVGNGILCVQAFHRMPVVQVGSLGAVLFPLDLASPPLGAPPIGPGSSWNFQFWYRDTGAPPAANNLSNALSVEFCE